MNYREFREKLILDAAKDRIPILGEFELTSHCNYSCNMCYVANSKSKNLTTEEWKTIFKKAHENGLFFALLTGGEIFMRKDFIELYEYLYDLGVKITLFSNGSLLNQNIISVFKKRPPEYIAITLYGASDETYLKITDRKNGFTEIKKVVNLLNDNGINFILRTIPLKPIMEELDLMIDWVKMMNMKLYYTQYVGPSKINEYDYVNYRLDPLQLKIFSDKIDNEFGYNSYNAENSSVDDRSCFALRSAYFINNQGLMMPCAMAYKPASSVLNDEPFINVFNRLYKEMKTIESGYECLSCKYKNSCMQCYARRLLENEPKSCSSYLKSYAIIKKGEIE